jgi:hypothetical protein
MADRPDEFLLVLRGTSISSSSSRTRTKTVDVSLPGGLGNVSSEIVDLRLVGALLGRGAEPVRRTLCAKRRSGFVTASKSDWPFILRCCSCIIL